MQYSETMKNEWSFIHFCAKLKIQNIQNEGEEYDY